MDPNNCSYPDQWMENNGFKTGKLYMHVCMLILDLQAIPVLKGYCQGNQQ